MYSFTLYVSVHDPFRIIIFSVKFRLIFFCLFLFFFAYGCPVTPGPVFVKAHFISLLHQVTLAALSEISLASFCASIFESSILFH